MGARFFFPSLLGDVVVPAIFGGHDHDDDDLREKSILFMLRHFVHRLSVAAFRIAFWRLCMEVRKPRHRAMATGISAVVGLLAVLVLATVLGGARARVADQRRLPTTSVRHDAERNGGGPNLVDGQAAGNLTALLLDLSDWILQLGLGENVLQNVSGCNDSIFINGNLARVLVGVYRLTGNETHLDEALAWCDTFAALQEHVNTTDGEPGGYWGTGYPVPGPLGDIYLGDTGTATTALAVCYPYSLTNASRHEAYMQALRRYTNFVRYGCTVAPPGRGTQSSPGWVIASGPSKGALGCGYYEGHLSLQPYTIATATTGAAYFAEMYSIRNLADDLGTAWNAMSWIATTIYAANGTIPYILDGTTYPSMWVLDTISYVTEGLIALDHFTPNYRAQLARMYRPVLDWLVAHQNADGSWGTLRSDDQQRSPRVVTLLSWYTAKIARESAITTAISRYAAFLTANGAEYGVKNLTITSGFVGLVVLDILQYGITL